MFSQNSVGTVYYISINKGRPEGGTQYSMREANERRPQIFVFEKDGTNAFFAEVASRLHENTHTASSAGSSPAPY